MVEGDGGFGPEGRYFGGSIAEDVVTAGGNHDRTQFAAVFVKPGLVGTIGPSGVLVEVGACGETGGEGAGHARSGVVIEHDDHGDIVGGGAGGGGAIGVSVVATLVGEKIVVAPKTTLEATGKVSVDLGEVRNA